MKTIKYDRLSAVNYAKKWALFRNPKFYDYEQLGGDCTNFISQCIYAGAKVMNYNTINGWYYINGNKKSPSWTGVEFLYRFLIKNKGVGPRAKIVQQKELQIGDIAQLSFYNNIYGHSLFIINIDDVNDLNKIQIATHTYDVLGKNIGEYYFDKIRFIHIENIGKY